MSMEKQMKRFLCSSLIVAVSSISAQADCDMKLAFKQLDNEGKSEVSVWQDGKQKALLFSEGLHVNTDGTKRSYKVDDFWGHEDAINNLCNAMSDKCAGMNEEQLRGRRILTQEAKAKDWPVDLLRKTKISPSIIAFNADGKPCDGVDGFLVSATSLRNNKIADNCNFSKYVDAMTVPAIVLPRRLQQTTPTEFQKRNAKVGDLAAILSGDGKILTYAVVGDEGPAKELGEATVALAGILKGKTKEPDNYCEVRGKPSSKCNGKKYTGQGWDVGKAYVLIFPGTRDSSNPYMTRERIQKDAGDLLAAWGGASVLNSCVNAYK